MINQSWDSLVIEPTGTWTIIMEVGLNSFGPADNGSSGIVPNGNGPSGDKPLRAGPAENVTLPMFFMKNLCTDVEMHTQNSEKFLEFWVWIYFYLVQIYREIGFDFQTSCNSSV